MSTQYSPKIVTNGLIYALDSGNTKSIPLDPTINLVPYSQDFLTPGTASVYIIDNVTATTGSLAPDGTNTATLLIENTINTIHRIYFNNTSPYINSSGSYYTVSFYAKAAGRARGASFWEWPSGRIGVEYNLTTGTIIPYLTGTNVLLTSSITPAPNGYYRISYTTRDTASYVGINTIMRLYNDAGTPTYAGNDLSGSYIWGYQVEKNIYPSPYFRTFATPAGRTSWTNLTNLSQTSSLLTGSISSSIPQFSSLGSGILNFDGIGSYANTGLDLRWGTGSSVSVEMWLKNGLSSVSAPFIGTTNYMWQIRQGTQQTPSTSLTYVYWDTTGNHTNGPVITVPSFFDGNWKHLVMTWDSSSSTTSLYKNGILQTAQTSSNAVINRNIADTVKIGGNIYGWGGASNWSGSIAGTKVYNRALSAQEVLQNYNATKTRFGL